MNAAAFWYLTVFCLIWWGYQGVIFYLFLTRTKSPARAGASAEHFFSIIVPTFNEEDSIVFKIESLAGLSGLNREVLFTDASSDSTAQRIREKISVCQDFFLITSPVKGRSRQINAALKACRGDIVIISDCDGIIPADALQNLARYFDDPAVAVAGALVLPQEAYHLDRVFWQNQNAVRMLESACGHCPVVSGVCYAFRKSLLDAIPEEVWSDDIYVPFLANSLGYRVVCAGDVQAFELRSPQNFRDFLAHKIRKAQDNIKELLRFLQRVKAMPAQWRIVFLTRFLQILVLPWLLVPCGLFFFFQSAAIKITSAAIAAAGVILQSRILGVVSGDSKPAKLFATLQYFFLTALALVAAGAGYLLSRGKIRYARV